MNTPLTIRTATEADLPLILRFIKLLAEYEKLADKVVATEDILRKSMFGATPRAECLLAFHGNEAVGCAIFFHNFSTFTGTAGLYLEDLFVLPEKRGLGVGKALLVRLAAIAVERNCARFEWSVLNWNELAIGFYRSIGAVMMDEWRTFRLSGEPLKKLAGAEKKNENI